MNSAMQNANKNVNNLKKNKNNSKIGLKFIKNKNLWNKFLNNRWS